MQGEIIKFSRAPEDLCGDDGRIHVAVLSSLRYGESNLRWVLDRTPPRRTVVFLYVKSNRSLYLTSPPTQRDKKDMDKILGAYMNLCNEKEIKAERLVIKMDNIADGLVMLISQNAITKLVMDAAEDWFYDRCSKMLSSQTAIAVNQQAHPSCKIWFVCHGSLIYTREATGKPEIIQLEDPSEMIKLEDPRRQHHSTSNGLQEPMKQSTPVMKDYDISLASYAEIVAATSNFTAPVLGEGGFGKVYKADLWGMKVAIKMLFGEGDLNQKKSFEKEVFILGKLNHPNLVRVVGACPEKFAVIYEYLSGGNLEDRLVKKDFQWQERLRILTDVCRALVFLHSPKPDVVIHGDIKPANILLDENGKSMLGDFGICGRLALSSTRTHHTTKNIQGTDGYIDPLFKRSGELSPKTDIYAFGMLILRLLAKHPPDSWLLSEVKEALQKEHIDDILNLEAEWPTELAEKLLKLTLRCCDCRKVENRPQSNMIYNELEQMMGV